MSLQFDMFSTENLAADVFRGCFVVTCTLFAFIGLVWLREQVSDAFKTLIGIMIINELARYFTVEDLIGLRGKKTMQLMKKSHDLHLHSPMSLIMFKNLLMTKMEMATIMTKLLIITTTIMSSMQIYTTTMHFRKRKHS